MRPGTAPVWSRGNSGQAVRNAPQTVTRNGAKFEDRTYICLVVMNEEFFTELSAWLTEAWLALPKLPLCLGSATDVSRLDFRSHGTFCLLTRFILSTRGACFAEGTIQPNLLCSNMAAPALRRSLRPASIRVMWRLPSAGDAAPERRRGDELRAQIFKPPGCDRE
jgi:hypothetical protein